MSHKKKLTSMNSVMFRGSYISPYMMGRNFLSIMRNMRLIGANGFKKAIGVLSWNAMHSYDLSK